MSSTFREEEIERSLKEDGFCILEGVHDSDTIQKLREVTSEIIEYHEQGYRDPYSNPQLDYLQHRTDQGVLYDVFQRHPEYQDAAKHSEILDAISSYLGPNIQLYDSTVVYKAESGDNEVPFHQDFMSRDNESDKIITWSPLFDVDRSNGCLKAIPGSHKDGTLSWHTEEGETHHDRLDQDQFDEDEAVYLEMNAGDVLLFHQDVVHGSDKITSSENPRYALRVVYKAPEAEANHVPRTGPIMLRGNDPDSLRSAGLQIEENDYDVEESFLQRVSHAIGRRLLRF